MKQENFHPEAMKLRLIKLIILGSLSFIFLFLVFNDLKA